MQYEITVTLTQKGQLEDIDTPVPADVARRLAVARRLVGLMGTVGAVLTAVTLSSDQPDLREMTSALHQEIFS